MGSLTQPRLFNLPPLILLILSTSQKLHAAAQDPAFSPNDDDNAIINPIRASPLPSPSLTKDIYGHTVSLPTPIGLSTFPTAIASPAPTSAFRGVSATAIPMSSSDDDGNDPAILNYYFLLLALLIVFIGILYLLFARRQRQKIAQRRQNGQRALARDLERWGGGGPWGPGRFRQPRSNGGGTRQPRREEGLDERGEAPPPYVPKEPESAHVRADPPHDIPLQDLSDMDHKPPDYDEGPSSPRGHGTNGTGPVVRGE
ncbi:MAG: hypothetical protein Q9166_003675 [cf. Caloplaca sp. 2 TL-2023]